MACQLFCDHFGDATLVHLHDPELPAVGPQGLSFLGDVSETVEEESGEGHVLPIGDLDPEAVGDVVDARLAVDQPSGPVNPYDRRVFIRRVELVVQLAHQRFDEILYGEHAGDAPVLVDDDGESPSLASHARQGVEDMARLRHDVRLADPAGDLKRRGGACRLRPGVAWATNTSGGHPAAPAAVGGWPGPEKVGHEENADEIVQVAVDHRERAVAGLADRAGDVVLPDGDGERYHVDARGHDLPHLHVPKVGQGVDDDAFLLTRSRAAASATVRRLGAVTGPLPPVAGRPIWWGLL